MAVREQRVRLQGSGLAQNVPVALEPYTTDDKPEIWHLAPETLPLGLNENLVDPVAGTASANGVVQLTRSIGVDLARVGNLGARAGSHAEGHRSVRLPKRKFKVASLDFKDYEHLHGCHRCPNFQHPRSATLGADKAREQIAAAHLHILTGRLTAHHHAAAEQETEGDRRQGAPHRRPPAEGQCGLSHTTRAGNQSCRFPLQAPPRPERGHD